MEMKLNDYINKTELDGYIRELFNDGYAIYILHCRDITKNEIFKKRLIQLHYAFDEMLFDGDSYIFVKVNCNFELVRKVLLKLIQETGIIHFAYWKLLNKENQVFESAYIIVSGEVIGGSECDYNLNGIFIQCQFLKGDGELSNYDVQEIKFNDEHQPWCDEKTTNLQTRAGIDSVRHFYLNLPLDKMNQFDELALG